ncbi:isoaspartyl peptidase/L-asparaginase [Microvirga aerilata]|uniref:Isoaspartyl peptidase n=1 Tax=Microvirga aerilata TaxID=670292 RepID=A0A936ZH00_9HYPH|nr:isoaspartyl peptidase/L-asparaginase [Microvirga aerilata]MBL0407022.1 isoaspartyl peptidase/L-asparaginase [Microvirga aerilata]
MTGITASDDFALAIHGGAGTILRSKMTPEREAAYHAGLRRSLEAGRAVLAEGGSALDAVSAAVMALEDEPLFNAGRGAVYTSAGKQEMDAAVMDGRDRAAGAVAGICGPRNPILAARAVMEHSGHVVLIGESALEFCRAQGLAFEEPSYFYTEQRWQALQETLAMRKSGADDGDESRKHGTVGAVARDRSGNLAAATSTGGMTAKSPGRVGDSPVIGAGTWADNETCAISATGHGEIFIRYAAAHEIASRMRYAGQSLEEASRAVVIDMLAPAGGSGGIIAVDHAGNVSLPFNCSGMYRGVVRGDGVLRTAIYDEPLISFQGR